MELKTAQITSNQIVCHSDTQITLENDMNVPDSKPDIDKIIKIEGNILSNSVVALDGRAGIKGTLDYFILYTSSDDIVPVHNLSGSINFDESVGLEWGFGGRWYWLSFWDWWLSGKPYKFKKTEHKCHYRDTLLQAGER